MCVLLCAYVEAGGSYLQRAFASVVHVVCCSKYKPRQAQVAHSGRPTARVPLIYLCPGYTHVLFCVMSLGTQSITHSQTVLLAAVPGFHAMDPAAMADIVEAGGALVLNPFIDNTNLNWLDLLPYFQNVRVALALIEMHIRGRICLNHGAGSWQYVGARDGGRLFYQTGARLHRS